MAPSNISQLLFYYMMTQSYCSLVFVIFFCVCVIVFPSVDAACGKDCKVCNPAPGTSRAYYPCDLCHEKPHYSPCDGDLCICTSSLSSSANTSNTITAKDGEDDVCGNYDSLDLFVIKENREVSLPSLKDFVTEYQRMLNILDAKFEEFRSAIGSFTNKPTASHASSLDYCYKEHSPLSRDVQRTLRASQKITPIPFSRITRGRGGRAALEALFEVTNSPTTEWSSDPHALRIILIVASTPCKEGMWTRERNLNSSERCEHSSYPSMPELRDVTIRMGVTPVFVVTRNVAASYANVARRIRGSVVVTFDGIHMADAVIAALDSLCKSEMVESEMVELVHYDAIPMGLYDAIPVSQDDSVPI